MELISLKRFFELIESVKLAFGSLRSNKLRSGLASLGVVVGISVVILMGWILGGLDKAVQDTFNTIGEDMLYVDKWDWAGGRNWKDLRARKHITLEQTYDFLEKMNSAEFVIPIASSWQVNVKSENETYQGISLRGTTSDFGLTPGGDLHEGRFFNNMEDEYSTNVVVIGWNVFNTIFPDSNAIGKEIKINNRKFIIIGVVKKQGTMFFDMMDNLLYVPLGTFISSFGTRDRSLSIAVKAGSVEKLSEVRDETRGWMRIIRNLSPEDEDDFSINETKAFEESVKTIRLYVWGIGIGMTALSFIVGMIGIMNIMFVTVTERTKEIGIRKAIGAKNSSILMQFLVESSALCFVGAIISLVLCSGIAYFAATYLPEYIKEVAFLQPYLPLELFIIATSTSVFIGMAAGLIPAMRAAGLDPVEALRFE